MLYHDDGIARFYELLNHFVKKNNKRYALTDNYSKHPLFLFWEGGCFCVSLLQTEATHIVAVGADICENIISE